MAPSQMANCHRVSERAGDRLHIEVTKADLRQINGSIALEGLVRAPPRSQMTFARDEVGGVAAVLGHKLSSAKGVEI